MSDALDKGKSAALEEPGGFPRSCSIEARLV
jgi:hypothetical protein